MHQSDLPPAAAVTAPARRVWTPVVLMVIYWAYQLSCRALNLDMFILWMSRVAVAAVIYLAFLGWWLLDLLLVTAETGEVVLLAADPAACRELGRIQAIEGKTWNHPVVARGLLYVRNAQKMACFELPPPTVSINHESHE